MTLVVTQLKVFFSFLILPFDCCLGTAISTTLSTPLLYLPFHNAHHCSGEKVIALFLEREQLADLFNVECSYLFHLVWPARTFMGSVGTLCCHKMLQVPTVGCCLPQKTMPPLGQQQQQLDLVECLAVCFMLRLT